MSILLAEGNPTHRRFARQLFDQHFPDYGPVREVADGATAIQRALTERPGLFMVDMDLPGVHGVEVARQIWAQAPDMKIIFWAQSADETCMRQTFQLIPPDTVYGYLLKSATADQFLHTVRGVLIDDQCVIARDLHRAYSRAADRQTGLTDVEYEALVDIALGLTDQAIAQRRFLSRRGVTSRLHALYSKLAVEQYARETDAWGQTFNLRTLAIRIALQRGLLNRVILEDEAAQLNAWLQRIPARRRERAAQGVTGSRRRKDTYYGTTDSARSTPPHPRGADRHHRVGGRRQRPRTGADLHRQHDGERRLSGVRYRRGAGLLGCPRGRVSRSDFWWARSSADASAPRWRACSRRRWLLTVAVVEAGLFFVAAWVAIGYDIDTATPVTGLYAMIVFTAVAMGLRNATVRRLAVPDLTTTVLTLTLTGIAADSALAGGSNLRWAYRLAAIVCDIRRGGHRCRADVRGGTLPAARRHRRVYRARHRRLRHAPGVTDFGPRGHA